MTVQRATLHVINGITYMYQRKRICDEMPLVRIRAKWWFLWRASDYEWEYLGHYATKREMLLECSK